MPAKCKLSCGQLTHIQFLYNFVESYIDIVIDILIFMINMPTESILMTFEPFHVNLAHAHKTVGRIIAVIITVSDFLSDAPFSNLENFPAPT